MKIFSFRGKDDDEEIPEGLSELLEGITAMIQDFADDEEEEPFSDEVKADHQKVSHLAVYMDELEDYRSTDGNKLRYLAMNKYRQSLEAGNCVHDCEVADNLVAMADRLDELDLKESEIGT